MGERQLRESPVRLLLQVSLGAIWVYDGLVTKLLAPAPHLPSLVVAWVSPGSAELVLRGIGAVELAAGLLLVQGWRLRATALAHCAVLTGITVGLAALQPDSLLTPLGAIPQNIPLIAAGIGLLLLTGERAGPGSGRKVDRALQPSEGSERHGELRASDQAFAQCDYSRSRTRA